MSEFNNIVLEQNFDTGVARIVLNRPDKHNAMNEQAQQELLEALAACESKIRVIIITGSGERSFCTGIDLKELPSLLQKSQSSVGTDTWVKVCLAVKDHPSVVIAAVNGYALGGGLTLVNVSDIAIAAEHATFGMPELTFGAFPRLAGPSTIQRIAPKNVGWMAFTAERIDAETARSWGLINKVCPAQELQQYVTSLAGEIANLDPTVLTWTKRGLAAAESLDLEKSIEFGSYVRAMILKERANL